MKAVVQWFVGSVGLEAGADPWELARRWGFSVRVRRDGSGSYPRSTEVVWIEAPAFQADPRLAVARALAGVALELAQSPEDPDEVALAILGRQPPTA